MCKFITKITVPRTLWGLKTLQGYIRELAAICGVAPERLLHVEMLVEDLHLRRIRETGRPVPDKFHMEGAFPHHPYFLIMESVFHWCDLRGHGAVYQQGAVHPVPSGAVCRDPGRDPAAAYAGKEHDRQQYSPVQHSLYMISFCVKVRKQFIRGKVIM